MTRRPRRRLGRRLPDPFPTVAGNSVAAFVDGREYFDRMAAAVAGARICVDLEMYLWDDDVVGRRFVDALREAAARGVRVRLLVDAHGAAPIEPRLREIHDAGGDVRVFNPFRLRFLRRYFHRTHKKLLVCDGESAFTGGPGFSDRWAAKKRRDEPWRDRVFEIRGPAVADLVRVFETDFGRWRARDASRAPSAIEAPAPRPVGAAHLRVLRGWPDARDFRASLLAHVQAAKERVWLGSPYFIPPPSLIRALHGAMARGADVRIVVPAHDDAHPILSYGSRRHFGFFLRRGARIYACQGGFYHAKTAVIDRDAALFGSSNLDYWSWSRNAEIDLLATDAATVDLAAGCIEEDIAGAREVTLRDVSMRNWLERVRERVAGWVEDWL